MTMVDDSDPVEVSPFESPSIIDAFRRDVEEISSIKDVHIPVKGYEFSNVTINYRLPDSGKELDNIARKIQREFKGQFERNIYTAIDTMIALCLGLYVQPAGYDEPIPLDPKDRGGAVTFDPDLAETLGLPPDNSTARQVVRKLFGNNDLAIQSHAEKLSRWLQDTKADLSLEIWQLQGEV